MSLLDRYAEFFPTEAKQKGRDYFADGAVRDIRRRENVIQAKVQGSELYNVYIQVDPNLTASSNGEASDEQPVSAAKIAGHAEAFDDRDEEDRAADAAAAVPDDSRDVDFEMECTCPEFQVNDRPCKHIWATFIQADAQELLATVPSTYVEPVVRKPVRAGWLSAPASAKAAASEATSTRGSTQLWRRNLSQLRDEMLADLRRAGNANTGWPSDWRLIYVIDATQLKDARDPTLTVEARAQQASSKTGIWQPTKRQLDLATWMSIPNEEDRLIAQMLAGARDETQFMYGTMNGATTARRFNVAETAYETTLRRICETGRCFLERTRDENEQLTPLEWDTGPAWEFSLAMEDEYGGEAVRMVGRLRRQLPKATADFPAGEFAFESANDIADSSPDVSADDADEVIADLSADETAEAGNAELAAEPSANIGGIDANGIESMPLDEPVAVLRGGLVIARGKITRLAHFDAWRMLADLRSGADLVVFKTQTDELVAEMSALPNLPPIDFPKDLNIRQVTASPLPRMRIHRSAIQRGDGADGVEAAPIAAVGSGIDRMSIDLSFSYGGHIVDAANDAAAIFVEADRVLVRRDPPAEAMARAILKDRGFKGDVKRPDQFGALSIAPNRFTSAIASLVADGWHVEADGKLFRRSGNFKMSVASGIDWFELDGSVDFDGQVVKLPALLAAVKRGESTVLLDDGSLGVVPQEWLAKYAPLIELGDPTDDQILKFSASQIGFLDALLAALPDVNVDETFQAARDKLQSFDGISAEDASTEFVGELRPYQREGLGWLKFLQRFSFGGCLADDMGLGKTIQVLAMLQTRAEAKSGPSLVVVPRSLVFNWLQEAKRFTPTLRVLDHSGIGRVRDPNHFRDFDLVITTYGTMRRDASYFGDADFDYVILDESQAIKNASTESAKAARLLKGRHRLAMSGTPIENHLGELWSLFDFLNPGMLGGSKMMRSLAGQGGRSNVTSEGRTVLARALRPFILRRTKSQVAKDLPEKTEQTIFCEMEEAQRKLYDELRDHYRQSLMQRIAEVGINRAKIQILEALLRLRQAACHPGLIDKGRATEPSAKLEMLMSQMDEVLEEGHKVLVFSQFTSFLAILRDRLNAAGTVHEYLDGKTRDRQQRVERFQSDPDCKLFLISLKAGGVGLNLTAADYVYLLDPWWNPAVESQAIDRAHRIGQQRSVFAYRLIAKGTVEEKVLELQKSKRDLADAIINADNSVVGGLKTEDLEMLLSS